MIRNHLKTAVAGMAVAGLAVAGMAVAAPSPASATTGYNINGWNETSCSQTCRADYCLWYSQGGGGGGWAGYSTTTNLGSQVFNIGSGAGEGKYVVDDAASMSNGTTNCHVAVWDNYNETGAYVNWLSPGDGGDLTSQLRNQDISIDKDTCT